MAASGAYARGIWMVLLVELRQGAWVRPGRGGVEPRLVDQFHIR